MSKLYDDADSGMHRPLFPPDEEFFRHGQYYKEILHESEEKVSYRMTLYKADLYKDIETFVSYLKSKDYTVLSKEDLEDRYIVTYEKVRE